MAKVIDFICQFVQNYIGFLILAVFWFLVLLLDGCGFPPPEGFTPYDNKEMIEYTTQKVIDYTGVEPEVYEIWMADSLERTMKACYGGAACNKFGKIVLHPDTEEYVCQQLVHEMWHSANYVLDKGWYVEPTDDYNKYMSETCRKFGNW